MPGSAHDGREDTPRGVVSSEAGLAHARPVVHHDTGDLIIRHADHRAGDPSSDVQSTTQTTQPTQADLVSRPPLPLSFYILFLVCGFFLCRPDIITYAVDWAVKAKYRSSYVLAWNV